MVGKLQGRTIILVRCVAEQSCLVHGSRRAERGSSVAQEGPRTIHSTEVPTSVAHPDTPWTALYYREGFSIQ